MTQDWTVNSLSEETALDRRTIKKILKDTAPNDVDGKTELYKLADFIRALIAYQQPSGSGGDEAALLREKVRKTAGEADIIEVERARIRKEVIETDTVFRVWENVCFSIRRTILTSPLPAEQKDSILNDLRSLRIEDYLEQQDFDEGTASENAADVHATSPA